MKYIKQQIQKLNSTDRLIVEDTIFLQECVGLVVGTMCSKLGLLKEISIAATIIKAVNSKFKN